MYIKFDVKLYKAFLGMKKSIDDRKDDNVKPSYKPLIVMISSLTKN